jgi:hypothetical protein
MLPSGTASINGKAVLAANTAAIVTLRKDIRSRIYAPRIDALPISRRCEGKGSTGLEKSRSPGDHARLEPSMVAARK